MGNVTWAMETGITSFPEMYKNYTDLTPNSPRVDFQCVLSSMVGPDEAGSGWGCPVPCNSAMPQCHRNLPTAFMGNPNGTYPNSDNTNPDNSNTYDNSKNEPNFGNSNGKNDGGSSFPSWAWILILVALLLVVEVLLITSSR